MHRYLVRLGADVEKYGLLHKREVEVPPFSVDLGFNAGKLIEQEGSMTMVHLENTLLEEEIASGA